jgi:hypothetical protein
VGNTCLAQPPTAAGEFIAILHLLSPVIHIAAKFGTKIAVVQIATVSCLKTVIALLHIFTVFQVVSLAVVTINHVQRSAGITQAVSGILFLHLLLCSVTSIKELLPGMLKFAAAHLAIEYIILLIAQVNAAQTVCAANAVLEVTGEAAVFAPVSVKQIITVLNVDAFVAKLTLKSTKTVQAVPAVAQVHAVLTVFAVADVKHEIAVLAPAGKMGIFAVKHLAGLNYIGLAGLAIELCKLSKEWPGKIKVPPVMEIVFTCPSLMGAYSQFFIRRVDRDNGFS